MSFTRFGCMAALLFTSATISPAQQAAVGEYPIPAPSTFPAGIAAGPDNLALWFTETNSIGRMSPAGSFTEYSVPTADSAPWGIAAGPDNALWFTEEFGNNIGRITLSGVVTAEYPVPSGDPYAITAGPDGALWFTEPSNNNIGRITTAGVVTEFQIPTPDSRPYAIAAGPDGALWFTELSGNNIGRITTTGIVTAEYQVSDAASDPSGITAGPDGALWFTEGNYDHIGRITTTGSITEYTVPSGAGYAYGITAGPDGALWFTGAFALGRITTDGASTEILLPNAGSYPLEITAGPDGSLWFTEFEGNKIGQVVFMTAGLSVSPAMGNDQTNLTFMGSEFAPNESVQIYSHGIGSAVLVSATADAGGSFTATAQALRSEYGPKLFLAVGQSSEKLGAADFAFTPRLILEPNAGTPGGTVIVHGFSFGSFETVNIYWQNQRDLLGTVTANADGTFSDSAAFTFTVPSDASTGSNMVIGKGQTTGAVGRASFTVD